MPPGKTELVRTEDTNGSTWRLALDESVGYPVVVVECSYAKRGSANFPAGWVHVNHVTDKPADVGLIHQQRGVIMLDDKKSRAALVEQMRQHGAIPRPALAEGISMMGTLPWSTGVPNIEDLDTPLHRRRNLLGYLVELEATAMTASAGLWRPADGKTLGAVLDAVVRGTGDDPGDLVAESLSVADQEHILVTQPWAAGAIARKLREAFYLLQDLSKAAFAARGEIDHLSHPQHRTESYKSRLDMFDRWMTSLAQRCAAFPTIQVPDFGPLPTTLQGDRQVVPGNPPDKAGE